MVTVTRVWVRIVDDKAAVIRYVTDDATGAAHGEVLTNKGVWREFAPYAVFQDDDLLPLEHPSLINRPL